MMSPALRKKIILVASCPKSLINFRLSLIKEFLNKNYKVLTASPFDNDVFKKLENIGVSCIEIPLDRNGMNPLKD
jgi:DNA-binding transcriptional MocR family regulator